MFGDERNGAGMETTQMSLFLKDLRKERGLTQEQAAEALFVSSKTLSRWETGATIPDLETLVKLAEYYKVDIKELIDGRRFGPDEAPDAASREKSALQAAAEYSSHKEKRSVHRTVLILLAVFLVIIGIYALFRLREQKKGLDQQRNRRIYGKVMEYSPKAGDGSYEMLLECDFDSIRVRVTPETLIGSEELRARLDAQEEGIFLYVFSGEYTLREQQEAERKGEAFVYPTYHIGNWKAG